MLPRRPIERARIVIDSGVKHPDWRRRPVPSAKAGRAAMRGLGTMTRAARRAEQTNAQEMALTAISDAVADLFHLADMYTFTPKETVGLHRRSLVVPGDPLLTGLPRTLVRLTFTLGNVLQLAAAYGWAEEYVIDHARMHFEEELNDR
ncbi:hypothetical protein [Streptomyces chartreusis]|uniref:Uncharacterized protein n=1 Tax=Streptomyces chartreusis TaxID=1969 RepID=A0A7H8T9U7_STRCX|nr:hypothetical protein [Streptomyces chartreusis]QKZ20273.1 hypothetical protein HUT05_24720 [Streptomyces chartreusis]